VGETSSAAEALLPLAQEASVKVQSRPHGHLYPLFLMVLALTWTCDAHTSYRATAFLFDTLIRWLFPISPCAETIRLWLLRLGLFLLERPVPQRADWALLLDHTIQLGPHKCLLIVGVRLTNLETRHDFGLTHHDVEVLGLKVLTSSTGEIVEHHLQQVCERIGTPVQLVSDHGSDVLKGIRLFKEAHPTVVETYDVTHGLACLLKGQLHDEPRWQAFVQACQSSRQQLQQTAGSFLSPPAWRTKGRYLNLDTHLRWAGDLLEVLRSSPTTTLAAQLGKSEAEASAWLEEKLGWLRGFAADVTSWTYLQEVVKRTEEQLKEYGLNRGSESRLRVVLLPLGIPDDRGKVFRAEVLAFVHRQGSQVPSGRTYVGSTDVLESLFGKYKRKVEEAPFREIGASILALPVLVTELTEELVKEAMETVRGMDVQKWLEQELGSSPQKKKRAVLAAIQGEQVADTEDTEAA
jgi:hypothetical protein